MKFLVGCALALGLSNYAWAQYVVRGKVTDDQQNPLIGATVIAQGTQFGTVTNVAGEYQLPLDRAPEALLVSYVGYRSQTIALDSDVQEAVQNIALHETASLEEVVIRAVRADAQAPVTQTTVEQETIESVYVGQDALFALERLTPSLLTYSESGTSLSNYGQLRLRGIDQTRVNITLNGVPLNDMIDQGVFFSNFTDFGNSIASVQVQRGVGTSTNGTSSYAGSINFESVNLQDSVPSVEVQLLGGSFDTYRASGEVKTGLLSNRTAFYGRFTRTASDGYRDNTSTRSYSFFFSGGYFGDKDMVKLTGFTGRSQNGLAYLPVALPDIQANPRTNYLSENDIDDFGQSMVQLQYTRFINSATSWTSTAYYGSAGGDFPVGFTTVDSTGEQFSQLNYPLFNDHYGLMSYVNYTSPSGQLELNGGIHGYTFRRENLESVLPDNANPYYEDRSRKDEFSAFAKASYQWQDLIFFGDLQLRTVSLQLTPDEGFLRQAASIPDRSWTFFNPKVGVTYLLDQNTNFYASYGRSGREPTRFDLLGSTQINTANLTSVQDTDAVDAEYVNDFEAGVRWSTPRFRGQSNLFYMQFTDEIAPIGQAIPEDFVQLRKNVENSYRRGLEIESAYDLLPTLTATAQVTYMQSNIEAFQREGDDQVFEDVEPIISPEWMVRGGLQYQLEPLMVGLSGRYVSESFLELTNQPGLKVPSFFVLDAQARIKLWKTHEFSLHVNNLLDERYYTFGQPVGDGTVPGYFVQAPLNAYAMLRLKF